MDAHKSLLTSQLLFGVELRTSAKAEGVVIGTQVEQAGADCKPEGARMECVLSVDHIESGRFAALYAVDFLSDLLVVELAESFPSEAAAWQALQDERSLAHPPSFFKEWVGEQYLTDRNARVERLVI